MMRIVTCFCAVLTLTGSAWAVFPGQVESFSGPVNSWAGGTIAPSGGPGGVGDRFLLIDTRLNPDLLGVSNRGLWNGDYTEISGIRASFANLGSSSLDLRLTITSEPASFTSLNTITLPPDGIWRTMTFTLEPSSWFWNGKGSSEFSLARSQIHSIEIAHRPGSPPAPLVTIAGAFGLDNVTAVPEPGMLGLGAVAVLCGCGRRRRGGV